MAKGKYGNRTRRRIKGGNSPISVKKSGTYGFGQKKSINPKPSTLWSKEQGFGFTPPVGDINVDEYNDATLFDDNVSLFNSASANKNSVSKKSGSKKLSLPKTSLPTDIDLKYSKIMTAFIELGNKMLQDTKEELARIEASTKAYDNKKLHEKLNAIKVIVDQWDSQNTKFNERALNFQQIDNGKPLKSENDYLDALTFIVKNSFDQFSKVKITLNPFMKKYKDKFKNGPKNPWWKFNITRKKGNKTGTHAIRKIQQTAKVNFNQASKIATAIRDANKPLTNKNIRAVLAATLKQEVEA